MTFDYISFRQALFQFYESHFTTVRHLYGLSQLEIELILYLQETPEKDTAISFVRISGFAKSNVSVAAEHLISKGLAVRERDEKNRRYVHLKLTDESFELVQTLSTCKKAFWKEVKSGITEDELESLIIILNKMKDNCRE